jgi:S-DNA-T family DNA segregation ATPase FtsK/SpoIIIE
VLGVFRWVVEQEIPRRRNVVLERARATPGERPRAARELFVSAAKENSVDPFPVLIVVVDEFAEIMLAGGTAAHEFEQRVQQVTQVGRSVLVNLILATQRPDASVVRGAIKANLDARVALRLPTHHDSMTVLGGKGAEGLLGRGDLIFQAAGQPAVRLQGYNA